jgi:serine/threonine protein kinase
MALTSGSRLGAYEIHSPLGAGGMGEVYRARDTRLEREVAIKVLPEHLSYKPEARERLEREARAISSLGHPNICHLYDVGQHNGISYFVMEYLQGETLADRLRKGPLPLEQVLRVGVEICEGLEKAHRSGVVHRDLKPSNIMLTKTGAKLMDFGARENHGADRREFRFSRDYVASPDDGGNDRRHLPIHVSRASRGTRSGRSLGRIRARCGALRDDHWPAGV